ncbi:MAG: bifunctional 4-hydroxy-2-oxoglutarate aldolase/2-dehydro-3-deoxy-phosphogluconate aldolase [Clostridiales bacterium]|nr:bifunctional 4-hydroxy-2-oxoglutarate aldolase/2-dehydro-3-deoxy-phosphogluconate aldolase [Clostridiales bacterium]
MDLYQKIGALGIVPVLKLNAADRAVPTCRALARGGLPAAEITFRTAAAAESIRRVAAELPEVLVGAGTVLTTEQADQAIAAGAKFIVTPGFNEAVVRRCVDAGVPVIPGCPTTSDIERALSLGITNVKFFPAETMGGAAAIKAISAPYSMVRFMPTGGVTETNLNQYLALPSVLACGGSWMAKDEMIDSGDWDKIEALTRAAVQKMLGFDLIHVGLNAGTAEEALSVARAFSALFGWPVKDGNSSAFAGTQVEVMKAGGRGKYGHLAVGCNSVARGRAYLEGLGFAFAPETEKVVNGRPTIIYLRDEVAGFAVHLLQR